MFQIIKIVNKRVKNNDKIIFIETLIQFGEQLLKLKIEYFEYPISSTNFYFLLLPSFSFFFFVLIYSFFFLFVHSIFLEEKEESRREKNIPYFNFFRIFFPRKKTFKFQSFSTANSNCFFVFFFLNKLNQIETNKLYLRLINKNI